jgi:hypothetical protein
VIYEVVLKMSRAPAELGARWRASGVYKGVHEHCEPLRNAAMTSAVVSKTASKAPFSLVVLVPVR